MFKHNPGYPLGARRRGQGPAETPVCLVCGKKGVEIHLGDDFSRLIGFLGHGGPQFVQFAIFRALVEHHRHDGNGALSAFMYQMHLHRIVLTVNGVFARGMKMELLKGKWRTVNRNGIRCCVFNPAWIV